MNFFISHGIGDACISACTLFFKHAWSMNTCILQEKGGMIPDLPWSMTWKEPGR